MKDDRKKAGLVLFCLFLLLWLSTCKAPDITGRDEGDTLSAPSGLKAQKNNYNNDIIVDWDYSHNDLKYELYRVTLEGTAETSELLTPSGTTQTTYSDQYYQIDKTIYYKVRSVKDKAYSPFASSVTFSIEPSTLFVQNVKASTTEFAGKICITWDPITQNGLAPGYKLLRYSSADNSQNGEEIYGPFRINPDGTIYYWDEYVHGSNEVNDKPVYYRVEWLNNGVPAGTTSHWAFGICRAVKDPFEPNNELNQVKGIINNLPAGTEFTIYQYNSNLPGASDEDWYMFENPGSFTDVTITFPDPKDPFFSGLYLEFVYKGEKQKGGRILSGLSKTFMKYAFANPINSDPNLYIRIYPDENVEGLGTYTLKLEN